MNWLLWKDYRHNRLIVFTALFLLLIPHLIALGVTCWAKVYWPPGTLHWKFSLAIACLYSIGISGLGLALIGGNAVSGERDDRSAEFLYALPIARRKLLASKLLLALMIAFGPWLTNAILLWYLTQTTSLPRDINVPGVLSFIAIAELACFGVSWFVSSLVGNTSFATLAGLLTPIVVVWSILLIAHAVLGLQGRVADAFVESWWSVVCFSLAPLCFAVGASHYLRRVEP
jgi:ABC-type transport system involved in multi-copper enzyme maturation permease subunit